VPRSKPPPPGRATVAKALKWEASQLAALALRLREPLVTVDDPGIAIALDEIRSACDRLYDVGIGVKLGTVPVHLEGLRTVDDQPPLPLNGTVDASTPAEWVPAKEAAQLLDAVAKALGAEPESIVDRPHADSCGGLNGLIAEEGKRRAVELKRREALPPEPLEAAALPVWLAIPRGSKTPLYAVYAADIAQAIVEAHTGVGVGAKFDVIPDDGRAASLKLYVKGSAGWAEKVDELLAETRSKTRKPKPEPEPEFVPAIADAPLSTEEVLLSFKWERDRLGQLRRVDQRTLTVRRANALEMAGIETLLDLDIMLYKGSGVPGLNGGDLAALRLTLEKYKSRSRTLEEPKPKPDDGRGVPSTPDPSEPATAAEAVDQAVEIEPDLSKLDRALKAALELHVGSAGRWKKRKELGHDDEEMVKAIRMEWDNRQTNGDDFHARGGKDFAFFLGPYKQGARATLKGPELVAAVRRVLSIGWPRPALELTASGRRKRKAKAEARP
jgi:hypothetical protein